MTNYSGQFLKEYERSRYSAEDYRVLPQIVVPAGAVDFPDVSKWQGIIDWDKMAANTKEVFLKISQNTWKDEQFERNYSEAKARGIFVGGYVFYDDRVSPDQQLNTVKAATSGKVFELEIKVDWETFFGGVYGGLPNAVKLMKGITSAGIICKAVGMYTGYYWFVDHSNAQANKAEYDYLKNQPLWLAWYASPDVVKVPAPWTNWTHWQYGTPAEGAKYGCDSIEIDKNKFNGNDEAFTSRYGGTTTPPPTGGSMSKVAVNNAATGTLNIRSGASTSFPVITTMLRGDIAMGELDAATNWLNVKSIKRNSGAKETVSLYCNAAYLTLDDMPAVQPPIAQTRTVTVDEAGWTPASFTQTKGGQAVMVSDAKRGTLQRVMDALTSGQAKG